MTTITGNGEIGTGLKMLKNSKKTKVLVATYVIQDVPSLVVMLVPE